MICPNLSDASDVELLIRRLEHAVGQPMSYGSWGHSVTASFGVVVCRDPSADPHQIIDKADIAMYRAKDNGRARYEVYSEALAAVAIESARLEIAMRAGLDEGRFLLYLQPIIDIAGGGTVAVEALLRFDDPARGIVAPAEFLDVAEDSGLIVPIGEWVIAEACRLRQRWADLEKPPPITVNISARQASDPNLASTIASALGRCALEGSALCLEINEGVLAANAPGVLDATARLRQSGVRLTVDDFGTGLSSLTLLRRSTLDAVKIDRTLVSTLTDPESEAIVRASIGLADALDITTIAEGVESSEQLDILQALGCRYAQGFWIQAPTPAGELTLS